MHTLGPDATLRLSAGRAYPDQHAGPPRVGKASRWTALIR